MREMAKGIVIGWASLLLGGAMAVAQTIPVVTGDARVDKLLSQMTLKEKLGLIHGVPENPAQYQGQAGYLGGVPAWAFRGCGLLMALPECWCGIPRRRRRRPWAWPQPSAPKRQKRMAW